MSSTESSRKRKLIYLWIYTTWGGAQLYMLTIMKLASEIWDVSVVLPRSTSKDVLAFYEPYNIPIEFLDHSSDPQPKGSLLDKMLRQFERIRAEVAAYRHLRRVDLKESVLHLDIAPWQSWVLISLLALKGANVFITLNNFRPDVSIWRRILWKARFRILCRFRRIKLFASNKDVKESLKEWLTSEKLETVEVAYSPIDRRQIKDALHSGVDLEILRQKFGVSLSDFVVLAVGQFVDRKGRWVFLDAAKKVVQLAPDVRFVWLMPEPISEVDKPRVDKYGLGDRFLPVVSADVGADRISIFNFFRIADVFSLPSYIEGLPIALIEAMALGIPCISTDVYAIPEAILQDRTGILVEPGDSGALSEQILRLRGDESLRRRLGGDGSKFALKTFDGRIMAAKYLEAYRRCFDQ